ncbi:AAA family ATPase [Enterococcus sp. LJL128]|uniref:AAA family ATPase n=1 Tax=Enterococcus sp. LJL51 TaxID=3416656 RepID=UPI003CF9ABCB
MKKYLILIAGSPATGKSYLIHLIKKVLADIFIITPDEGKELYADSVGFDNLNEKAALEERVWQFYYGVLKLYMNAGKKFVVSEYPFSAKQKKRLNDLAVIYNYEVITIRLTADFEQLWARRELRDREPDRHLSHIMTHYHYGDCLRDRSQADNLITKKEFKKIIELRRYNEFSLGHLFEYDVSDFSTVDYSKLLAYLANLA